MFFLTIILFNLFLGDTRSNAGLQVGAEKGQQKQFHIYVGIAVTIRIARRSSGFPV